MLYFIEDIIHVRLFATTQKILWGCLIFMTFLTNKCSTLKTKRKDLISTALVLKHTARMPNFTLYQTKSKFRPTSTHWILTCYSFFLEIL